MSERTEWEPTWETFTKLLDRSRLFLLADLLVLLLIRGSLQALPRQATPEEIHEDMPQRFQVVSTRLFYNHDVRSGAPQIEGDDPHLYPDGC